MGKTRVFSANGYMSTNALWSKGALSMASSPFSWTTAHPFPARNHHACLREAGSFPTHSDLEQFSGKSKCTLLCISIPFHWILSSFVSKTATQSKNFPGDVGVYRRMPWVVLMLLTDSFKRLRVSHMALLPTFCNMFPLQEKLEFNQESVCEKRRKKNLMDNIP